MKDELTKNNTLVYSVWYKSKDSYGQMKDRIATEINKLSEIERENLKY